MFERIMVPLDGSRLSLRALPYATEIALRFGAEVILVRVEDRASSAVGLGLGGTPFLEGGIDPNTTEMAFRAAEQEIQRRVTRAQRYLSRHVKALADKGIEASKRLIVGPPGNAILKISHQERVDLIVMTTRGRSGLKRAVLGSVADELVRAAGVPVLVIRQR